MHLILAKAVAFGEALEPAFRAYTRQVIVNATALARQLSLHGYQLVSGGTDNHLLVIDFRRTEITGRIAQEALESVGLVANKNLVPFDERNSVHTSGLRIGTPAATTRGMLEAEMRLIGDWIAARLSAPEDASLRARLKDEVLSLTQRFPVPGLEGRVAV
jgi:glycine hydroxymethyltransferase